MQRKFKTGETVKCTTGSMSVGKIIFAYLYDNEWIYTVSGGGAFGDIREKYLILHA